MPHDEFVVYTDSNNRCDGGTMHDFCRTLHTLTMADVREHTTAAQRKATWAYKFTGKRPTFEWHGPNGYLWTGQADCLWDAKAKGWSRWLEKSGVEGYQRD